MTIQTTLSTAIDLAHQAGAIIRQHFGESHDISFKGEVDLVTEVDIAAESLIREGLEAAFPGHQILAEEEGGDSWNSPGALWIIDPLDGTNNFAHNFPHIGVSIALLSDGVPQIGVVYDPLRDETFAAYRGGGATCNHRAIHVSPLTNLGHALLATGFPYSRRAGGDNNTQRLDHFLRRSQGIRRAGAAVLDLAYVACGRLDGFWEIDLKPWDVAAGILIVQEAGGKITDFAGDQVPISGSQVLASNGHIHDAMLYVIREGDKAPYPNHSEERRHTSERLSC